MVTCTRPFGAGDSLYYINLGGGHPGNTLHLGGNLYLETEDEKFDRSGYYCGQVEEGGFWMEICGDCCRRNHLIW